MVSMCVSSITLTRNYPLIGCKTFTVPCGKCSECLSKKRSELAALSVLQAKDSGSVYFLTMTYDNDHCPVSLSEMDADGVRLIGFERGCSDWITGKLFMNAVKESDQPLVFRACSLCREDVKKWFKVFRSRWLRSKGEKPDFKYLTFGEYGEQRGRPHYHALVYGLTREQVEFLSKCWSYGACLVLPQLNRSLDYQDVINTSEYVSKYMSKGTYSRWLPLLDYVEKPRRQSSIDFGVGDKDLIHRLASFTSQAVLSFLQAPSIDFDLVMMIDFLLSLRDVRQYLLTAGNIVYHKV